MHPVLFSIGLAVPGRPSIRAKEVGPANFGGVIGATEKRRT
jgi:hypothetical protein